MPTLCLHRWDGSLRVSGKLLISMAPWVGIESTCKSLILADSSGGVPTANPKSNPVSARCDEIS